MYALTKTRHYCLESPKPVQIYTDHLSLRAIENKDLDKVISNWEVRLLDKKIPFNYQVNHIKASENVIADALSRNPIEHYDFEEILGEELTQKVHLITPIQENFSGSPINIQMPITEAQRDQKYKKLLEIIKKTDPARNPPTVQRDI